MFAVYNILKRVVAGIPNPAQLLFASPVSTPNIDGTVPDTSGNSLDGRFKSAPCLSSAGSGTLTFPSLSGFSLISWDGTSTLAIVSNTITATSGTAWNIVVNDGVGNKTIPCAESQLSFYPRMLFYDDGSYAAIANVGMTLGGQDEYFFNYANGAGERCRLSHYTDSPKLSWSAKWWNELAGSSTLASTTIADLSLQDFAFQIKLLFPTSSNALERTIFSCNCCITTNNNAGWVFALDTDCNKFIFLKATSLTVTQSINSSGFTSLKETGEHDCAVVKNGTTLDFYLDGSLISSHSLSSATINYSSTRLQDTVVGARAGGTLTDLLTTRYLHWCVPRRAQVATYSAAHVTNITNQENFTTQVRYWKLEKRTLIKNQLVYDEEIKGDYLIESTALNQNEFPVVLTDSVTKGTWKQDYGYTLDLTNRGAHLAGQETDLAYGDGRDFAAGQFVYFDDEISNYIRTHTAAISAAQVLLIEDAIGYMRSDGLILIKEIGQSNSLSFNAADTDPDAAYLAVQDAWMNADPANTGTPIWEKLEPKVNNQGIVDNDSISANIGIANESQTDLGADMLGFTKRAVGNSWLLTQGGDDWNPASSNQYLDKSNDFDFLGLDNLS